MTIQEQIREDARQAHERRRKARLRRERVEGLWELARIAGFLLNVAGIARLLGIPHYVLLAVMTLLGVMSLRGLLR